MMWASRFGQGGASLERHRLTAKPLSHGGSSMKSGLQMKSMGPDLAIAAAKTKLYISNTQPIRYRATSSRNSSTVSWGHSCNTSLSCLFCMMVGELPVG